MRLEDKLFLVKFKGDKVSHLNILSPEPCHKCTRKQCTYVCPGECYKWENDRIIIAYEGCLECGTCRIACHEFNNIDWVYPLGGYGVSYRFG